MLAISASVKKRRQVATERRETPKKSLLEPDQLPLTTHDTCSQRQAPKVLCFFLAYEEPTKNGGFITKDLDRLRSAEEKYRYEAHTISMKKAERPLTSLRHLEGDMRGGFGLCIATVRKWKDINFDMIAFDWHYRDNVPSNNVFEFILGAPGFMNSGGIVDIPCTPHFYEGHLAAKGRLDELFDVTFLHEHELTEKSFLSEAVGDDGSQHTKYCKITRKLLETHSCNKANVLRAYEKMMKDHGGVEDICMIRLTVKHNIEALQPTDLLRLHEQVRDEKKVQAMKDNGEISFCRKGPETRNGGRCQLATQVRPALLSQRKRPLLPPNSSGVNA
jgi:hypothetical protein